MESPVDFSLINKSMNNDYLHNKKDHMYQMYMNMNGFLEIN